MGNAESKRRVLLIDDETLFARAVAKRLGREGIECEVAGTLEQGRSALRAQAADLLLLDMRLPDGAGLDFLAELRDTAAAAQPVVVLTAFGDVDDAVAAMKLGAVDYLKKPIDLDDLAHQVERVFATLDLSRRVANSQQRDSHAVEGRQLIGESPTAQDVRSQLSQIADLAARAPVSDGPPTVLLLGETGTGKDLAARMLHTAAGFSSRPFVQVDCAALPRELIEAELFGHERGSYTGAQGARAGLIEAAEDGTVFLDEIAELAIDLQAKLLAVLERRALRRIGSTQERPVRAWIVAATNRDLEAQIAEGEFRADLYYRLNVLTVALPPLRERRDDIERLARHFAESTARRYGMAVPEIVPDALRALRAYAWPGNVRELKHVIERAVLLARGQAVDASRLMLRPAAPVGHDAEPTTDGMTLEDAERMMIERALERSAGNVSEAARQLGVTRMALRYRVDKYGIKVRDV